MSYLGRGLEQVDNISKLDNITFNGGTTYALTKDSAAFTPISSNAILISIDGVIQQGNFSVSGTNIVFNFSPTGSNTCDFIMHYGTGLITTPADDTVSTAKIQNDAVTKDKVDFVTDSGGASLEAKGSSGYDGAIRLNCSVNSHFTELKSASHGSYSGNLNFTLPSSTGTNGQFLQTNGSGVLSFADAGGGLVFLGGTTLSSTVSDIALDHFSSTYNIHKIYGYLSCVTAGSDIGMRFRDGGSDITSSNYIMSLGSNLQLNGSTTSTTDYGNWLQDHFNMISGSISSGATIMRFEVTIFNAMSSTFNPAVQLLTSYYRTANQYVISMGGGYLDGNTSTTCEGFKFIESSGNGFDGGAVRVYGVVSS